MPGIVGTLNSEWDRLVRSAEAQRAVERWRLRWPALEYCTDLQDVLELRSDPTQAQAVLRPLALMSPLDDMAARTLLQALLPGLVLLARSAADDDAGGIDDVVAIAWERIRTYPGHREGSVAGNVLLDVRKRYSKQRGFGSAVVLMALPPRDVPARGDWPDGDAELVSDLMRVAVASGVVRTDEVDTIVRSRMFDVPLSEIAAERGISSRALGQQRWRAEGRLRRMPRAAQVMSWSAA